MQREICKRITDLLATLPDNTHHVVYELLAALKLPGMNYLQTLYGLHLALKPKLYVEIGVRRGESLFLADPSTRCVAIDPDPRLPEMRENVEVNVTTSDKFFYNEERAESIRGFDLAFIDGDHSFEQAARDFTNLERLAGPHSIIAIHDVIPMDERTATPTPETSFHTGDVWQLMAGIVAYRPDLVALTVACPPSGLGLVGRFNPPPADAIQKWNCPFPTDWEVAVRMLNIFTNDPKVWGPALQGNE